MESERGRADLMLRQLALAAEAVASDQRFLTVIVQFGVLTLHFQRQALLDQVQMET